ncbi:MAG: hypothetical protein PVG02_08610 [Anaerolineales bacterium]
MRYLRTVMGLLLIGASIGSCNAPMSMELGINQEETGLEICSQEMDLGLNLEAAAQAPAFLEGRSEFGTVGIERANELADEITSSSTFCELELPQDFYEELQKAEQLANEGNEEEARLKLQAIEAEYITSKIKNIKGLAKPVPNQFGRTNVLILLTLSEYSMRMGLSDGQAYLDSAKDAFRAMAEQEMQNPEMDEMMRLFEEAERLGERELAEKALELANNIWKEKIEAKIEDFDPCLDNPEVLKQDITDLLNALAQGMLLGIEGTMGPGGSQYDAVFSKASIALKQLAHLAAPALEDAPEECGGFTYAFEVEVSGGVLVSSQAFSCKSIKGPWTGDINLSGSPIAGVTISGSGAYEFTVPEQESVAETRIPTSGTAMFEDAPADYSDNLRFRFTLTDDKSAEIFLISDGQGSAIMHTEDGDYPVSPFATIWTTDPAFMVDIEPYAGCNP